MTKDYSERSRYYQSIARFFIARRGAPFLLSSKDLLLISDWERMGIPLRAVLEGIDRAFEIPRGRTARKDKILSLAFCRPHILRAFEQEREKRVGGARKAGKGEEKRLKTRKAVQEFLDSLPAELAYLKDIFIDVQKRLSRPQAEEENLEHLEETIEKLLVDRCPHEEKERLKIEIRSEYPIASREEFQRIFRLKVVKFMRDRYRVPYISLYQY